MSTCWVLRQWQTVSVLSALVQAILAEVANRVDVLHNHGPNEFTQMATLAGQRTQFTWALNQYNQAEDAEKQAYFAKRMAKYIAAAPANGFTVEQVT